MKYVNKSTFLIFLCSFSFYISSPVSADSSSDFDEFDNILNSISEETLTTFRSCEPGEAKDWGALLDTFKIPTVFDEDLYNVTTTPTHRNIINYPNFFIFSYQAPAEQQMTCHLFYNQAVKKHFTKDEINERNNTNAHNINGTELGSYLNIDNGTFASVIAENLANFGDMIPPSLSSLKQIQFPKIFKTLAKAHLEERRIGFLAHYYKQLTDCSSLEIKLPFLWQERNINFDDIDQKTLRREFSALEGDSKSANCFDELEFAKDHIIMDALGTGTMDITWKYLLIDGDKYDTQIGFSIFLPTDGHWKQGLYGTYFEPKDQQPILRLCDLVNIKELKIEPDAQEKVQKYFLSALDHFSSAVLQCQLGYDKHLAFAFKALPYWQIREDIEYSGVYIFEYLIPQDRERFFVQDSPGVFSEEFSALQDKPEQQLDLFERQITKRLFPRVFTARVSPGFLFNTVSNFQKSYKCWNFTAGYNYWYKSDEKIKNIKAPQEVLRELNVCKATPQSASQIKVYGKVHRTFTSSGGNNVSFAFYGNISVYSDNIGNDFSLGVSFDKEF